MNNHHRQHCRRSFAFLRSLFAPLGPDCLNIGFISESLR
jgi:hypothetical protein